MTKIERVRAVLAGKMVDRTPFSIWYHFGTQFASPEKTAEIHLGFFKAYDLDFLKVMNDYDYPMPKGMEIMATPEDLKRLESFRVTRTPLGKQLKAVEIIAKELKRKALFVDTVFNAWNTLKRNLVKEAMARLMDESPDALTAALQIVNANLIQYALASLERGSAGIFLSVPATEENVTREQFEKFMRPYDLALLEAIRGKGEFHILHAHGERIYLDRLLDYPVQAISWADLNGGPEIAEMRRGSSLTLMAGIDHVKFPYLSAAVIREQVRKALDQSGKTRFIVAPGCSVPTYSFPPLIRAARDAARS